MTSFAKNIILMISDGQGYNSWIASDLYEYGKTGLQSYQQDRPDGTKAVHVAKAQRPSYLVDTFGQPIENSSLSFRYQLSQSFQSSITSLEACYLEQEPYTPESFWRSSAYQQHQGRFMDSAAASTVLSSGEWTTNGRLNVAWDEQQTFETIVDLAKRYGKKTGVVTTVQASHATPAGMAAKQSIRGNYEDIFQDMLSSLDVIMGCGHPLFDNHGHPFQPEDDLRYQFLGGKDCFDALEKGQSDSYFVDSTDTFTELAKKKLTDMQLIAIVPVYETLQQKREELESKSSILMPSGLAKTPNLPELDSMVQAAIQHLKNDTEGFFLLIEGGAVDWAHHANDFNKSLEEHMDFNRAIDVVINWVESESSWEETLLIITADHETGSFWANSDLPAEGDIDIEAATDYLKVPNNQKGLLPKHVYLTEGHSNNLVPLWALGVNNQRFLDSNLYDPIAQRLWGEYYHWDGSFIEANYVFKVMKEGLES